MDMIDNLELQIYNYYVCLSIYLGITQSIQTKEWYLKLANDRRSGDYIYKWKGQTYYDKGSCCYKKDCIGWKHCADSGGYCI